VSEYESQPKPRDWGDRLVCFVCATRWVDPARCRTANVIVNGYGVCLDDIQIIEFADAETNAKNDAIVAKRAEVDAVLRRSVSDSTEEGQQQ
jgi:hypothetical protein